MIRWNAEALQAACVQYEKPEHFQPFYGTAGFRAEGGLLGSTLFR